LKIRMVMLGLWGCQSDLVNVLGGRAEFLQVFRGIEN
jgi:hypothetical protein